MKRKTLTMLLGCCMVISIVLPCFAVVDGWRNVYDNNGRIRGQVYTYTYSLSKDDCKMPKEYGGECRGYCYYTRSFGGGTPDTKKVACKNAMGGAYGSACRCAPKADFKGLPPETAISDTVHVER